MWLGRGTARGQLYPAALVSVLGGWALECPVSPSEVKSLSRVRLLVTPRTVAYQAPLFMGFSRQEYWSGVPFPSPGV